MRTPRRTLNAYGTILPRQKRKAIWLWQASRLANDPDTVIDRCSQNHINEIHVQWSNAITTAHYRYFNRQALKHGITVHALHGDPTWALTDKQDTCLAFIDAVHIYNQSVLPSERFEAIHLDVEPHGLNGTNGYPNNWNTDKAGTIQQWVDNSDVWIARAKGYRLPIGGAFAFWLDDELPPAAYSPKTLAQVMIDKYDYYAVMAYRDNAASVISAADAEMNYASSEKILVGIETTNQQPITVTFFPQGFAGAEAALKTIHDTYAGKAGYRGIAIHDFAQWEKFLVPYGRKAPIRILAARS